jgi:hypothetical protein
MSTLGFFVSTFKMHQNEFGENLLVIEAVKRHKVKALKFLLSIKIKIENVHLFVLFFYS